jgi:predicted TPR repeat methyltransferase
MRAPQTERGAPPAFLSSGDLLADRRHRYAMALTARGERDAAIDLLAQAIALAPGFASAWFALGELRAQAGDRDGAVVAFREARAADPEDRAGAALRLARLDAADGRGGMPPAYVRTLFDQYAPNFDAALVDGLGYRAPALLRTAIERVGRAQGRDARCSAALDLGCGTGLAGETFRPLVAHLTGVDLSPGMIVQASAKSIYDRLEVGDLVPFLAGEAERAQYYDRILAADVFPYFPDLAPIARAAARVLAVRGLLAFTTETHPGDGVVLGEKLRYAHGAAHVRAALDEAGLVALDLAEAATRTEAGAPAPGLVVVAARTDEP